MGMPAARVGDDHSCPVIDIIKPHEGGPIVEGSPNVFIGGVAAARLGDKVQCNGPVDTIVEGEPTVFINGRPAARIKDKTAHGGVIVAGCTTVCIGTSALGRCAERAAALGSPFIVAGK